MYKRCIRLYVEKYNYTTHENKTINKIIKACVINRFIQTQKVDSNHQKYR